MKLVAFVVIVAIAILSTTTVTNVKAQVITFDEPIAETNYMNLSILFSNGSRAGLLNEPINEAQSNAIVASINSILLENNEALEDLELEEPELEEIEEIEEEEESDSDNNGDGNGNNNDDDNNGNGNNNDEPEPPEEPEPFIPGPELPPEEEEEDENDTLELDVITKGCFGEGLGYHRDGPYKCYPIDRIGEEPPEGQMYCAALGCPYNPPDLSKE